MGGSGGPGERKGGELGEQSFVYMGFKGAALDLARGRAPRGSGPRCLPFPGLSGLHPEPCTLLRLSTCGLLDLPLDGPAPGPKTSTWVTCTVHDFPEHCS